VNTLKALVDARFTRESTQAPLTGIGSEGVRASGIHALCPRFEVLRARRRLPLLRQDTADARMTFLHGDAIHWAVQNRLLPELEVLVGRWGCLGCGDSVGGPASVCMGDFDPAQLVLRPRQCPCGSREFGYQEMFLQGDGLQGHPDGFLRVPWREDLGIFEAKSVGYRPQIEEAPLYAHVLQVHVYMHLTGLRWGTILYWHKAGKGVDALVEHTVDFDPEIVVALREEVRILREGLDGGALPARVCGAATDAFAQRCDLVTPCFEEADGG